MSWWLASHLSILRSNRDQTTAGAPRDVYFQREVYNAKSPSRQAKRSANGLRDPEEIDRRRESRCRWDQIDGRSYVSRVVLTRLA